MTDQTTETKKAIQIISVTSTKLSKDFTALERIIRDAQKSFIPEGKALCEITNKEYYVQRGFSTLESYVNMMFDMTRDYAYKRMAAFRVMHILTEEGFKPSELPQSESQCRPLTKLNGEDSELYQKEIVPTWKRVLAHKCRITAALIQKEVNVAIGRPEPKKTDAGTDTGDDTGTDTGENTTDTDTDTDNADGMDVLNQRINELQVEVKELEHALDVERKTKGNSVPNSKIARDMIQAGFKAIVPTLDDDGKKEALSIKAAMLGL